jgi:hypothetical protein
MPTITFTLAVPPKKVFATQFLLLSSTHKVYPVLSCSERAGGEV